MKRGEMRLVFERRDDTVQALLAACQRAIQKHPLAARAIVTALVEEGRRFAQTPGGAAWSARLESSELVESARMIWETLSLTAVSANAPDALPSACIDAVVHATAIEGLEPLLSKLMLGTER